MYDKTQVTDISELPIVLTPMEIAKILGVSKNTVYQIMHRTDFPSFKFGDKHIRVYREKFIQWLNTADEVEQLKNSKYE